MSQASPRLTAHERLERPHRLAVASGRARHHLSIWRPELEVVPSRAARVLASPCFATVVSPLAILGVLTVIFHTTSADVAICRLFYQEQGIAWPYHDAEPWLTLYRIGPLPGVCLGILGAVVALGSLAWSRLEAWRDMGLFLAVLLAVGPGLIINGIIKPEWGRPRPGQIKAFGGEHEFVAAWAFGPTNASKSFPCGHASMGFYWMGPAFLLYRRRPGAAAGFVLLGLAWGLLLGLGRIAQGQHFASDVIWSGGLVYFTGLLLGLLFQFTSNRARSLATPEGPIILQLDEHRHAKDEETTAPAQPRRRAA